MKKPFIILISLILLIIPAGCGSVPSTADPIDKRRFFALDTLATITIYETAPGTDTVKILNSSEELCEYYEGLFSRTRRGSDVYRINHSSGRETAADKSTLFLIEESLKYSELTDGLFDITIAPVVELWDSSDETLPDSEALSEALSHVSDDNIIINKNAGTVRLKDPKAAIDLGALAKGYIADRIKEQLISDKVTSAVIDLGGNILTIGSKPDGSPYNIGIKAPFSDTSTYYAGGAIPPDGIADSVKVTNRSVVTSGIYERYRLIEDRIYHHVLNPKTGYPVDNTLAGVTIISDTSLEGDCLSTACLLMGKEKTEELINSLPDIEAVLIEKDGTLTELKLLH